MFFAFTLSADLRCNIQKSGCEMSQQLKPFECISLRDLDETTISNVRKGWITITIILHEIQCALKLAESFPGDFVGLCSLHEQNYFL